MADKLMKPNKNPLPALPTMFGNLAPIELPELDIPQTSLVKGDVKCLSIAAASVLAKTTRDALMRGLDSQYPGYGLGKHKGYGTPFHRLALKRLGYSTIHRKSFSFHKN